ncbi:TPA_asm: hypothetical protein [Hydra MELD virus]|nr:TPA_asm: hypothetical protein [Hydra MELD virus]
MWFNLASDLFKVIHVDRDRDIKVHPIPYRPPVPPKRDSSLPANDTLFSDEIFNLFSSSPKSMLENLEKTRVESNDSTPFSGRDSDEKNNSKYTTSTPIGRPAKKSKAKSDTLNNQPVFIPSPPKKIETRSMRRRADQVHES